MIKLLRKTTAKPLRFLLTLAQLLAGSLAMMVALSAYMSGQQTNAKTDQFIMTTGDSKGESSFFIFDAARLNELQSIAPDVASLSLYSSDWSKVKVEYNSRLYEFTSSLYVDRNYFEVNPINLTRGSAFSKTDETQKKAVILISDAAAAILFADQNPVGQTLKVLAREGLDISEKTSAVFDIYEVVGTFAINETTTEQQVYAYLPYWMLAENQESNTVAALAVPGRGDIARAQLTRSANQVYGEMLPSLASELNLDPNALFHTKPLTKFDTTGLNIVLGIFTFFGAITSIIAMIGIVSIMAVALLERKRDIGIKRALGATQGNIISEIMLESTLITGMGTLLGIILALLVIPLLSQQVGDTLFLGISLRWQPLAALIVFLALTGLGALFGLFPALRAARMNTIESIKSI
jgi:putative ABC transport system permease protein